MSKPFVPIEELAKHFSVSVSTVRSWLRQGHIPKHAYVKVGNTYRFNLAKIVEHLTGEAPIEPEAPSLEATRPLGQLELAFNDPNEDM